MQTIETVTDRITLVVLDIRIWSGRKKLRPEDLNLGSGEIPPEELVSLGSKRVFDPEALKVFSRLKQSAERACLSVGTRFLGGFAVPNDEAAAVASALAGLKAQFDTASAEFLRDYDQALAQWIATLPAWEEPIRRAVEPANVVGGRLHFGFQLIAVRPAEEPGTLVEEVQGLGDGIFAEVSQMARELDTSFEGKDKLHRRALATFARIREKLGCLSFIDARIQPVVDTIDDWLERLPKTGPIAGAIFNEGMGLALLLGDPQRMARHGAGQLSIQQGTAEEVPEPEEPKSADFDAEVDELIADIDRATRPPQAILEEPGIESFFF